MTRMKPYFWISVSLAGTVLIAACQAPQQITSVQHIPQITKLCEKATATPPVHRFRRPVRDAQARVFRQLSAECDRLMADVGSWEGSAELTAASTEQQDVIRTDIRSLRTALEELRSAANRGDARSIRSAHTMAATAYTDIGKQMDFPGQ